MIPIGTFAYRIRKATLAVGLALFVCSSFAARLNGRVIGIIDGDTVDLLVDGPETIRVRVAGVDAPESRQAFGGVAKHRLSDLVFSHPVVVEWTKRDRYGRVVGKIVNSQGDVGLLLVRDGLAWHYKKYQLEQSYEDRRLYDQAERSARARRIGIWSDPNAMSPWDFRKLPKSERKSPLRNQ